MGLGAGSFRRLYCDEQKQPGVFHSELLNAPGLDMWLSSGLSLLVLLKG